MVVERGGPFAKTRLVDDESVDEVRGTFLNDFRFRLYGVGGVSGGWARRGCDRGHDGRCWDVVKSRVQTNIREARSWLICLHNLLDALAQK